MEMVPKQWKSLAFHDMEEESGWGTAIVESYRVSLAVEPTHKPEMTLVHWFPKDW